MSWPTPLPYKVCTPERIWVVDRDSVRQRAVLDSLLTLLAGRWLLVEEGAGGCFVPAHSPIHHTEMVLTKQGEGIAYVSGKQETAFQLLLSFYWGNAHFVMNEQRSKSYFGFCLGQKRGTLLSPQNRSCLCVSKHFEGL